MTIISRKEEVLECSSFKKHPKNVPVNFHCAANAKSFTDDKPITLTVTANGFSYINGDTTELILEDASSKIYRLTIATNLINQVFNQPPVELQDKKIEIINVIPKKLPDNTFQLIIT